MAFVLIISVRKLIFDHENTFERARKYVPMYMWMVGFMISMVTLVKGLKHIGIDFDLGMGSKFVNAMFISAVIGLVVAAIGAALLRKIKTTGDINSNENIERIFGILMIFTACGMAFAHGSNDVANAVGPLAAVVSTVQSGGVIGAKAGLPWWVLGIGAAGIVVGLATYGWRVIQTIGRKITELTPSRGFAAELAAASTVVLASATGLPISTTHTLVGAVLGVGLARGVEALNLRVVGAIIASWVVTLPAGAGLAIVFFYILSAIFGA
jgi:PiT family inorganic phosphate transporter